MNFFELMQSDSPLSPTLAESLLLIQQNWIYLTRTCDKLMSKLALEGNCFFFSFFTYLIEKEKEDVKRILQSCNPKIKLLFSQYYQGDDFFNLSSKFYFFLRKIIGFSY